MNLLALPAFTDNYIWMIHDGRRAVVVDPGDAAPVVAALESRELELAAILVTHHHSDHIGGIQALRPYLQGAVYGPPNEPIPPPCHPVSHQTSVNVMGLRFDVINVPGHTLGHVAYFLAGTAEEAPVLFCGDTLFSGGCGRLFEGTPAQMHASLMRLAALPEDTRVCCGHEYTLSNLRFAQAVEPDNAELAPYTAWCEEQRAARRPTLPSNIGRERALNPFLRCAEPAVAHSASRHGAASSEPVSVLAALRQWKTYSNDFCFIPPRSPALAVVCADIDCTAGGLHHYFTPHHGFGCRTRCRLGGKRCRFQPDGRRLRT